MKPKAAPQSVVENENDFFEMLRDIRNTLKNFLGMRRGKRDKETIQKERGGSGIEALSLKERPFELTDIENLLKIVNHNLENSMVINKAQVILADEKGRISKVEGDNEDEQDEQIEVINALFVSNFESMKNGTIDIKKSAREIYSTLYNQTLYLSEMEV